MGAVRPSLKSFVDRFDPRLTAHFRRQIIHFHTIHTIAGADLDLLHAIQYIQLGQSYAGDAADLESLTNHDGIEPTAPTGAARNCAELFAPFAQTQAHFIRQFGRERALAYTSGIGLGNAQDIVDGVNADAGASIHLTSQGIGRRHIGIGTMVYVQHGSLRALEQDAVAGPARFV